jgi:hypothetical protein
VIPLRQLSVALALVAVVAWAIVGALAAFVFVLSIFPAH